MQYNLKENYERLNENKHNKSMKIPLNKMQAFKSQMTQSHQNPYQANIAVSFILNPPKTPGAVDVSEVWETLKGHGTALMEM